MPPGGTSYVETTGFATHSKPWQSSWVLVTLLTHGDVIRTDVEHACLHAHLCWGQLATGHCLINAQHPNEGGAYFIFAQTAPSGSDKLQSLSAEIPSRRGHTQGGIVDELWQHKLLITVWWNLWLLSWLRLQSRSMFYQIPLQFCSTSSYFHELNAHMHPFP